MKKRILAFTLTLAMLLSMASIVASAAANPTEYLAPLGSSLGVQNFTTSSKKFTTAAEITALKSKILTWGLTSSDYQGTDATEIAKLESTDLGLSAIGLSKVTSNGTNGRVLSNAIDGEWGQDADIAQFFCDTGVFYDQNGTKYNSSEPSTTDNARYTFLLTFNLGTAKAVEALGFIVSNPNNFPQCFDIYVSNDGVNWGTPIAYYDRLADRTYDTITKKGYDSTTFTPIYSGQTTEWTDNGNYTASAQSSNGGRLYYFPFQNIQTAQYVRIASTAVTGVANSAYVNDQTYTPGKGSNARGSSVNLDELFLFGTDPVVEMSAAQTTSYANGETAYDARFVAEISDTINSASLLDTASKITFNVTSSYDNHVKALTFDVYNVYTTIMAAGEEVDAPDGKVFAMFEITGIPVATSVTFKISATVTMKDGTTITSVTKSITLPVAA